MSVLDENAGIDDVKIAEETIKAKYKEVDEFRLYILSTHFDKTTRTYWRALHELPQSYSNLEESYKLNTDKLNDMYELTDAMRGNYNSLYHEWLIMRNFIRNVLNGDLPKPSQELLHIISGEFQEKYHKKLKN